MAIDLSGWAQAAVASVVAAGGAFFFAGGTKADLHNTQQQVATLQAQQSADHDKITSADTKLDDLSSDVKEIKQDVKTLLKK